MATPSGNSDTAVVSGVLDATAATRPVSVLIVGSDPGVLDACVRRLESAGIRAASAQTGFEAIVKACWHLPDVIVMQRGLMSRDPDTGLDGSVAAQLIRVCPATAHIPILDASAAEWLASRGIASRDIALLAGVAQELSGS